VCVRQHFGRGGVHLIALTAGASRRGGQGAASRVSRHLHDHTTGGAHQLAVVGAK